MEKENIKKQTQKMRTSKYLELKGFLSFLILHELNKKNLCGDELALKIGKRKKGKLTPGTIYPALKQLRDAKLVKFKKQGRKKTYHLTEEGTKELKILYKQFSQYFYGLKKHIRRY